MPEAHQMTLNLQLTSHRHARNWCDTCQLTGVTHNAMGVAHMWLAVSLPKLIVRISKSYSLSYYKRGTATVPDTGKCN